MAGPPRPTTVSTKQARIASRAKQMSGVPLRTLAHHIDLEWLREAHRRTRKSGAVGIDGQTAEDYASDLDANLASLLERMKSGQYRAPPVRRIEIPKGSGESRPLGIPTFEDKVLQRAVAMVLEPIYEQEFYNFSYGFRPGRSTYDCQMALRGGLWREGGGWVLDVDVSKFFDTLDHRALRDLLSLRVADRKIVQLVGKWLRAGALDEGVMTHPTQGTPQGGVISPLLANIYLHHVVDNWWITEVRPRLRGHAFMVRYADDLVLVFKKRSDALRVLDVLPRRLGRFGLSLHPDKTRLVDFRRPSRGGAHPRPGSFDFLGFTLFWAWSYRKRWVLKAKTAKSRLRRALRAMNMWMKRQRHRPLGWQARELGHKMRGHYAYYGIRGNVRAIWAYHNEVLCLWKKWLSRRSQRAWLTWPTFKRTLARYPLPRPRIRGSTRQLRLANL